MLTERKKEWYLPKIFHSCLFKNRVTKSIWIFINRTAIDYLQKLQDYYPITTVMGPRQSGKTTLVRHVFPNKPYVNLEAPDIREFAKSDPRQFLSGYPKELF